MLPQGIVKISEEQDVEVREPALMVLECSLEEVSTEREVVQFEKDGVKLA